MVQIKSYEVERLGEDGVCIKYFKERDGVDLAYTTEMALSLDVLLLVRSLLQVYGDKYEWVLVEVEDVIEKETR